MSADNISAEDLIDELKLQLVAGIIKNDQFLEIDSNEEIDVGTNLQIKLKFKDNTNFQ